jgi:glycine C-acetyltransferase
VIANLQGVCALAERYGALVMVDDSHAVGFVGETGRGTHELCGVMDRVDIITGTLGKALGGASGGYTAARQEVIALLRQRSRPYLFSNTLPPGIVGAARKALKMLAEGSELRQRLWQNTSYFRERLQALGFELAGAGHPIIPVMIGEAPLVQRFAGCMLEEGIYVVGFFFPVVPQGKARIRTQMSAAHNPEQLDQCIDAFARVGRELGVIP